MRQFFLFVLLFSGIQCRKKENSLPSQPAGFVITGSKINEAAANATLYNINYAPVIKMSFSAPVDHSAVNSNITFSPSIIFSVAFANNDSTLLIHPESLAPIKKYSLVISAALKSQAGTALDARRIINFVTKIDSADKFPRIPDSALLDLVQKKTFSYFWDFGHPVSGMARERNTSGNLVTTGGTGFGIMAIPAAVKRNFISRAEGLARVLKIVNFYKNNCTAYHGAFSHWIDGASGATIPFSPDDNGADIVETSYLMEGLLTARQFFSSSTAADEIDLRSKINQLWDAVEWNWFRKNNENVLYWHWSPDRGFIINAQVRGWNEALITYVMAASSGTNAIPRIVYDNGWADNGSISNNNVYYTYPLPLGPDLGGPLFFEHYSFLGIDPNSLADAYANYQTQTRNHTLINYNYCRDNPRNYFGYSDSVWGLTASDIPDGYAASSPTNDLGVIAPTASLSSFPYTPAESMKALKFYYYVLGDKLFGQYGFVDAFKLSDPWFADSFLAIDQGPIIVMIENYRSRLLWDLFTSCPEIKNGMRNLGFTAPYL